MGWPRGVPRKGYVKKSKEVMPDARSPSGDEHNEQPASQPVTEVRARPRLTELLEAQRAEKFSWKSKAGNLWGPEGQSAPEEGSVLAIPREVYPPNVEFMWGTRSIRGMEMPQILSSYKHAGWFVVNDDELSQWPALEEYCRDRWARDESGNIVYEACILLIQAKEKHDRAVAERDRVAKQQLLIREQAITGGGIQASGAKDPSALGFNKIKRTVERIEIPKD